MRHQRNRVDVTVLLMGWAVHAGWRGTDCKNASELHASGNHCMSVEALHQLMK